MKIPTTIKQRKFSLLFAFLLAFLLNACNKEESTNEITGTAVVHINMLTVDSPDALPLKVSSTNPQAAAALGSQVMTIPYNKDFQMEVTLTPENSAFSTNSTTNLNAEKVVHSAASNVAKTKAPLPIGTPYILLVYTNEGKYIEQFRLLSGQEQATAIKLNAGETYTFVCVSYGNNNKLPNKLSEDDLATADLSMEAVEDNDLMHAVTSKKLVFGDNNLSLVLTHKMAQITTEIDATAIGDISNVSAVFKPYNEQMGLSFKDGIATFDMEVSAGKAVSFLALNQPKITSNPTLLGTTAEFPSGSLDLTLTIAGVVKGPFKVEGLKFTPGQRYTLSIKFIKEYFGPIIKGLVWAEGNLKYSVAEGYTNAKYGELGDYFPSYKMLPAPLITYDENPSDDPCSGLAPVDGKAWRMPTNGETERLHNDDFANMANKQYFDVATVNGRKGILYREATLFFPHAQGYERTDYDPDNIGRLVPITFNNTPDYGEFSVYVTGERLLLMFAVSMVLPEPEMLGGRYGFLYYTEMDYKYKEFGFQVRCVHPI